jgi:pyruvate dehydrogenase E2 component (dihydrolipoamide acetyltransferase)
MPIEVNLAKLSPTMESGQMVRWLVKVGDRVKEGDTLAEIQTDKAVMPMESFDEGVVAHLDVKEGDEIALGQRVLVLAGKGEDPKQVADRFAKGGPAAPAPTKEGAAARKDSGQQGPAEAPSRPEPSAPRARPSEPAAAGSNGNGAPGEGRRIKSSPLARKIAAGAQVDLASIRGTGPGGRIIRDDVEAYLARRDAAPAPTAPTPAPAPAARPPAVVGQPRRVPHSPMRKTIAKRMVESKQSIPEIHVAVEVRLDKVMEVREALNKQLAAEKVKLSVSDFITKAAALALRRHPGVNASFEPDAIVMHPEVNLGIAVAMEGGLMVPVLRNADQIGLRDIRLGTDAIVSATRAGSLKPNQMMGGTFTISNLGMYGVKQFDAIINQPEVAILAVGAGEKRPVVEGDKLVVGTVMTVNLTADHRAVDGAMAAEFLRTFRGFLEEPSTMLL